MHIRTDLLDLMVSLTGGTITQADLNEYSLHKGQTQRVRLENHDSPESLYLLQVALSGPAGAERPNQLATFTAAQTEFQMLPGQDELRVPLHWTDGHGVDVTKEFVFRRGSYAIGVTQTVDNHSTAAWPASAYAQIVRNDPPTHTSLFSTNPERFASHGPAIWDTAYRKLKITDADDKQLNEIVRNGWIAAIQHQFVTAVVPPANTDYRFTMNAQGDEYVLAASSAAMMQVPAGGSASFPLTVFLGPKLQAQLATAGPNLQRVTDFGKLFVIAQPLFKALSWVHSVTGNWGVAILIVTLLLKLIFYPLSETSGKSMAKMRALQPRIKNIQEQYKDDKEKLGRATMELYQKEKVNPVSGCLPDGRADPGVLRLLLGTDGKRGNAPGALCAVAQRSVVAGSLLHPAHSHGRRHVRAAAPEPDVPGPGAGESDDVHADRDVGAVHVPAFRPGAVLRDEHRVGRVAAVEYQSPHYRGLCP